MAIIQDQEGVSFRELDRAALRVALEVAGEVLGSVLEQLDEQLLHERDEERYSVKEIRKRQVDTLVGSVGFSRRYYYDRAKGEYVALLDRVLGLDSGERVSPALTEVAVAQGVRGPSYREAAQSLTEVFGYPLISHETIRRRVLATGDAIPREQRADPETPRGRRQVPLLYLEVDGHSVHMQSGERKRREAQLLFSHEGWRRRHPASEDYELMGGRFYHRLADPEADFWEEASRYLYRDYDLSHTQVVINGDRAAWIRQEVDYFPRAMYQVDRWHMVRDLRFLLRGTGQTRAALAAFYGDDPPGLLAALATAEYRLPAGDKKVQLADLRRDLLLDPGMVRDYRDRLREQGYSVSGMRGMGAAESQVDRFKNRIRKRGQSWSKPGVMAMLHSLGQHLLGSLDRFTQRLSGETRLPLPDRQQRVQAATRKVVKRTLGVKQAHPPIKDAGRTRSGGMSRLLHQLGRARPSMT